jgi:hypothetical protein
MSSVHSFERQGGAERGEREREKGVERGAERERQDLGLGGGGRHAPILYTGAHVPTEGVRERVER